MTEAFGQTPRRSDVAPRLRPTRIVVSWLVAAVAILITAGILPGFSVGGFWVALVVAALIAVVNAVLPPVIAAIRLPYTVATAFLLVLLVDVFALRAIDALTDNALHVGGFGSAFVAALLISGASTALEVVLGTNDDESYALRVVHRIARRSPDREETEVPGIIFLEIDGLAKPVLQRAMRDGNAPQMARWLAEHTHHLIEWETDLSSQTGASQAGILLGSNEDIPAFRWVEKERGELMVCSNPDDCAEIERRHSNGDGLVAHGGASRGNLLSGDADHVLLTASRIGAEKQANPGYRAFFANGYNVTRSLVLFFWEVILEIVAAMRQRRRDVRPRGHRGGKYPFLRAGMCVVVRDLTVYAVLSDMFVGRPAVYATFASYDEVAHHSGLERPDTLEALRKLDEQFGRIERARRFAPRPYHIVVLSDHGQTQGATFKQRNGYGLDELVRRSVTAADVRAVAGEDENHSAMGVAFDEARGKGEQSGKKRSPKKDVSGEDVVVLGSGNLGLVYLMEEPRRFTLEELEQRHPALIPALREHPHVGFVLVRSAQHGPVVLGARGARYLAEGRVEGEDPLVLILPDRCRAPAPLGRVRACPGSVRQQLLRPRARRGLRVRGAHLVPRWHGGPADTPVRARAGRARFPGGAVAQRGGRPPAAQGMAIRSPEQTCHDPVADRGGRSPHVLSRAHHAGPRPSHRARGVVALRRQGRRGVRLVDLAAPRAAVPAMDDDRLRDHVVADRRRHGRGLDHRRARLRPRHRDLQLARGT